MVAQILRRNVDAVKSMLASAAARPLASRHRSRDFPDQPRDVRKIYLKRKTRGAARVRIRKKPVWAVDSSKFL
jgi:hypothetical protein